MELNFKNKIFIYQVQESLVSDGRLLSNDTLNQLLAQISFPSDYVVSLPPNVEYTIYTRE